MATSPTLRPDPLPREADEGWTTIEADATGATIIDLDSAAVEDALVRLREAPVQPLRVDRPAPAPPRIGAAAQLLAACLAPAAWLGVVQLLPLSETGSSVAVIVGWVSMAAIVQRWNTRERSTDP